MPRSRDHVFAAIFIQLLLWLNAAYGSVSVPRVHSKFASGLCIDCDYNLSGLGPTPRCPECGRFYETPPTETISIRRYHKRTIRSGIPVLILSPLLLLIDPILIRVAYHIAPLMQGFSWNRISQIASADAEASEVRAIPLVVIVSAPMWLACRRPRRVLWRFLKVWAASLVVAVVVAFLHSRSLWI